MSRAWRERTRKRCPRPCGACGPRAGASAALPGAGPPRVPRRRISVCLSPGKDTGLDPTAALSIPTRSDQIKRYRIHPPAAGRPRPHVPRTRDDGCTVRRILLDLQLGKSAMHALTADSSRARQPRRCSPTLIACRAALPSTAKRRSNVIASLAQNIVGRNTGAWPISIAASSHLSAATQAQRESAAKWRPVLVRQPSSTSDRLRHAPADDFRPISFSTTPARSRRRADLPADRPAAESSDVHRNPGEGLTGQFHQRRPRPSAAQAFKYSHRSIRPGSLPARRQRWSDALSHSRHDDQGGDSVVTEERAKTGLTGDANAAASRRPIRSRFRRASRRSGAALGKSSTPIPPPAPALRSAPCERLARLTCRRRVAAKQIKIDALVLARPRAPAGSGSGPAAAAAGIGGSD